MSAAAARRRKQLAKKAAAAAAATSANENPVDPITLQIQSLLSPPTITESTAYEALQLAQSQVRRHVKLGPNHYPTATETYAYNIALTLLTKHSRVSVASQLLTLLVQVLKETHTVCDEGWIQRMVQLHQAYLSALDAVQTEMDASERGRLLRLHLKFLRSVLSWSERLGGITFGALEIQEMVGVHSWRLSNEASSDTSNNDDDEEAEGQDLSSVGLKCEAVTHLALAEKPNDILDLLRTLPKPTKAEVKMGHTCPPALRDALLTRAILAMVSVENLRDAHILLTGYIDSIEERGTAQLKKSYMDKTDQVAPSHIIFNSMLLSICCKDKKTGPLYTWLLRSFTASEFAVMYKPDVLKAYTTKIGRVYFDILPPPSMISTLENMMAMMGGGAGGAGGGMGGMNPAMMQAMMGGAGGGF